MNTSDETERDINASMISWVSTKRIRIITKSICEICSHNSRREGRLPIELRGNEFILLLVSFQPLCCDKCGNDAMEFIFEISLYLFFNYLMLNSLNLR